MNDQTSSALECLHPSIAYGPTVDFPIWRPTNMFINIAVSEHRTSEWETSWYDKTYYYKSIIINLVSNLTPDHTSNFIVEDVLHIINFIPLRHDRDRLCGLVVRRPGCRPRGPGFDSRQYQIFCIVVGLERGPLSPCEDKWGATSKKSSGS
jgi:hypothetical protein